eukprot:SAG31_NODE_7718_length_1610_cov_1.040371_3_plen_137_part_00
MRTSCKRFFIAAQLHKLQKEGCRSTFELHLLRLDPQIPSNGAKIAQLLSDDGWQCLSIEQIREDFLCLLNALRLVSSWDSSMFFVVAPLCRRNCCDERMQRCYLAGFICLLQVYLFHAEQIRFAYLCIFCRSRKSM